jgi:hypothetical protein
MAGGLPNADAITCWGTLIKAALAFVDERRRDARRRVIARIGPEGRSVLTGTVLPSSHYPLAVFVELLEAIDAELGRGDLLLCPEIGRFSANYQVNLFHRAFLAIASLDFWFRMAGSMWHTYYNAGTFQADAMHDAGGRVTLTDFNPISKAFCYRFAGWLQRICEMSRLRNVDVRHTACMLDGAPACAWDGTWDQQ